MYDLLWKESKYSTSLSIIPLSQLIDEVHTSQIIFFIGILNLLCSTKYSKIDINKLNNWFCFMYLELCIYLLHI